MNNPGKQDQVQAMVQGSPNPKLFIRHVALPQDHGSWVFLFSPLLIGLFAESHWSPATPLLVVGCLAAFLVRQPVATLVKIHSGRRNRRELAAAWFWTFIYGIIGTACLLGLLVQGYSYLLWLALPGLPVFAWHLYLVSQRSERRQMGIELIATGVLSLAAPAAYWVGVGTPDPMGWWLFLLSWLQAAASIVYAYLRLEQRNWDSIPGLAVRMKSGKRAWLYAAFNLALTAILGMLGILPNTIFIPFVLQFGETSWGVIHPALGWKPTRIGIRQLVVSSLFTVLFILAW